MGLPDRADGSIAVTAASPLYFHSGEIMLAELSWFGKIFHVDEIW